MNRPLSDVDQSFVGYGSVGDLFYPRRVRWELKAEVVRAKRQQLNGAPVINTAHHYTWSGRCQTDQDPALAHLPCHRIGTLPIFKGFHAL
jgi:hypothetical protein